MQVCGFKFNVYQGYDTVEEARSHWVHALATGTWGDPRRGEDLPLPPFDGYHIIYNSSVDATAIPLSEALRTRQRPTTTTPSSTSSTYSYSTAQSAIATPLLSRLHFPV
jgi:hypothetical protein